NDLAADPRMEQDHRGKEVTKGDALQHADKALVSPVEFQETVIDKTEDKEQNSAADHPPVDPGGRLPLFLELAEGEGKHHSDDKQEKREDQVVEVEALPVDVLEL